MFHNIVMNKFKDNLRELRTEKNLTQKQLANELGVLERTVSYWENGSRECDFDTLILIAKFFGVTIDYLLGLEN